MSFARVAYLYGSEVLKHAPDVKYEDFVCCLRGDCEKIKYFVALSFVALLINMNFMECI